MRRALSLSLAFVLATGCATTVPYTGVGPYPQLERGAPLPPVDFVGNILSLPMKLLLWDWRFNRHAISSGTEETLVAYLKARDLPTLEQTKFRLNQYRPGQDVARLIKNRSVAWPYRLLLGLPVTLLVDLLLPGRLFPWGDYYNPYTNTVHLYSDHPAIALHEAGHAFDFARRKHKGTYAAMRLIPFVDLYQEAKATQEAIGYLQETHDRTTELSAYKILSPAYGSYVGNYVFAPIGTTVGILLGHLVGRTKAMLQHRRYEAPDASADHPFKLEPPPSPANPPAVLVTP